MKLYFINRFFYPDFSATSQMLTDLGTGLAGEYDVTAVNSRTFYNDALDCTSFYIRVLASLPRSLCGKSITLHWRMIETSGKKAVHRCC